MTTLILLTLKGTPITKKNHMRILKARGRHFLAQSEQYTAYEQECMMQIPQYTRQSIADPVNVRTVYFMPTHRRVDLTNLMEATHDILVRANVLQDDNCNIIKTVDGSCVEYDKENPRVEIEITRYEGKSRHE